MKDLSKAAPPFADLSIDYVEMYIGDLEAATICGFGDVDHTLVQRDPSEGLGLPASFIPAIRSNGVHSSDVGLQDIDHTGCLVKA